MIRNGNFATYNGKEYKYGKKVDGIYYIIGDKNDFVNGFHEKPDSRYINYVNKTDLTNPVSIRTWAKYKGRNYYIVYEKDAQYTLAGEYLDKDIGFKQTGWGEFTKLVNKDDVDEVYEKVEPREIV